MEDLRDRSLVLAWKVPEPRRRAGPASQGAGWLHVQYHFHGPIGCFLAFNETTFASVVRLFNKRFMCKGRLCETARSQARERERTTETEGRHDKTNRPRPAQAAQQFELAPAQPTGNAKVIFLEIYTSSLLLNPE